MMRVEQWNVLLTVMWTYLSFLLHFPGFKKKEQMIMDCTSYRVTSGKNYRCEEPSYKSQGAKSEEKDKLQDIVIPKFCHMDL